MIVMCLHQRLPVLIAVPEGGDPQLMVLARFCSFGGDLSFVFSSRNTLIQFVVHCSEFLVYKVVRNDFVKF